MSFWKIVGQTALVLGFLALPASAESYAGIGPYYTPNDVKAIFPNGYFEYLRPAWAQPHERVAAVSGPGISGRIMVVFSDTLRDPNRSTWDAEAELYRGVGSDSDPERAVFTRWIRWFPSQPVLLERLISIYGNKFTRGVNKSNLEAYASWPDRQVLATLDASGRKIVHVEYGFTAQEISQRLFAMKNQAVANRVPPPSIVAPDSNDATDADTAIDDLWGRSRAELDSVFKSSIFRFVRAEDNGTQIYHASFYGFEEAEYWVVFNRERFQRLTIFVDKDDHVSVDVMRHKVIEKISTARGPGRQLADGGVYWQIGKRSALVVGPIADRRFNSVGIQYMPLDENSKNADI